jgi:hypothetical protein
MAAQQVPSSYPIIHQRFHFIIIASAHMHTWLPSREHNSFHNFIYPPKPAINGQLVDRLFATGLIGWENADAESRPGRLWRLSASRVLYGLFNPTPSCTHPVLCIHLPIHES